MTSYIIDRPTVAPKNEGIAREWALCAHYNVERVKHDSLPYDKGSDLDAAGKHISIKASGFTLMSHLQSAASDSQETLFLPSAFPVDSSMISAKTIMAICGWQQTTD